MRYLLFSLLILFAFSCNKKDESVEPDEEEALYVYVNSGKDVYCLNPHDGSIVWMYNDIYFTSDVPAPTIIGNVVYVSGVNGVYALDALTGKLKWQSPPMTYPSTSPTIDGKFLYVGALDRYLYALDISNGEVKWSFESSYIITSPTVFNDNIYFTDVNGSLMCLNKVTGNLVWQIENNGAAFRCNVLPYRSFILTGLRSKLVSLNAKTGEEKWAFSRLGNVLSSPVLYNQKVFFTMEYSNSLFAVNADDGTEVWKLSSNYPVYSSPYVKKDSLFFCFFNGDFYSLNPDNGTVYWKTNINSNVMYSSQVAASGKVFFSVDKSFICLNSRNGSLEWQMNDNSTFSDPVVLLKNGNALHPSSSGHY